MCEHEEPKKHPPLNGDLFKISIIPTVKRYFYIPKCNIHLENGSTIPSNLFINDEGKQTIKFTRFIPNGYINLYVNGVMQEGKLYVLHANYLTLYPIHSIILAGTPIIVESLGFNAKITL
ncbi:DUF4183 domain-containing protein [Psychrobacillus glaciei]|nr:DUF4183 domain-containing protein [Psychrobacillus glaciei]